MKNILEERASVLADMKKVVNFAMSENRALNSEEQQSYDKMNDRVTELTKMKETTENYEKHYTEEKFLENTLKIIRNL